MSSTEANLVGLRVFISYPRGGYGHTWAEAVQHHLEHLDAEVWRDETAIGEGDQNWCRRIEQGLETADLLICIIGQETEVCAWQQREMLRAVERHTPIIPLRIAKVGLPLYIQEKQPVEVRDRDQETLNVLVQRIDTQRPNNRAGTTDNMPPTANTLQRQREIAHLEALIHKNYSDREGLYVPLEGRERRSPSLARAMKTVRMDTDAVLRAFGMEEATHISSEEKTYADVLDAYRTLQHQNVRRLAVLGEPGAGKSFSLERIAVEYAQSALRDPGAPIPLLVALGFWTRDAERLEAFIARQLGDIGRHFDDLLSQRRAVLLLDAMNEIPPGQRKHKADQIQALAQDERFASVVVTCREKDYMEFSLPFDTLTLQPLKPTQILEFLRRALSLLLERNATTEAEERFWTLAGGAQVRDAWEAWRRAGADLELFWMAEEVPQENPNVYSSTSVEQDEIWRVARCNPRSLIRLAANPYLLKVMTALPRIPANRAQLFRGFLDVLYNREKEAREARHDVAAVPEQPAWEAAMVAVAAALQYESGAETADGAQTSLARERWPADVSDPIIDFSRDASVLERYGDELRFTHQLLQEYLASRLLLEASRTQGRSAHHYWPAANWWERSGWEVVAEIAAESCGGDEEALTRFIAWLATANPDVASQVWRRFDHPALPQTVLTAISDQWFTRMTDVSRHPHPAARAAIGRALGRFGLDQRHGVGVRADGLPEIDWIYIPEGESIYQDNERQRLPGFHIARYPITHAQFQAFINAGGYEEARWWQGLAGRIDAPWKPEWDEPNSPREIVSWYEAVAFCHWLSARLGYAITLPTEQQWERAARGGDGREYPWGDGYWAGYANCDENVYVARTTAVGLYPHAPSQEGVLDLAGNVWEWCLNEYSQPDNVQIGGAVSRVLRGGSWNDLPWSCRAAYRYGIDPDYRNFNFGFRVCYVAPIE